MDSLLCPWDLKALTFSLSWNPLNMDSPIIQIPLWPRQCQYYQDLTVLLYLKYFMYVINLSVKKK